MRDRPSSSVCQYCPVDRIRDGKFLRSQTFSKTLRKPVYAGRIVVPEWDIDISGKFQPLVIQAVFDKVQLILHGRAAALTPRVRCHEGSRQLSRNSVCSRFYFQRVLITRMENFETAQHAYFSVEYSRTKSKGFRLRPKYRRITRTGQRWCATKYQRKRILTYSKRIRRQGGRKVAITPRARNHAEWGPTRKP